MENNFNLEEFSDEQLLNIQNEAYEIIKGRNLERGDLDEIIDSAFKSAFPKIDGLGSEPWIEQSILICPGARIDSSSVRHKCRFVVVDDEWSWESSHQLLDIIRRDQSSKNLRQHSITLVTPFEGMQIQVVSQKSQQGKHLVGGISGYIFRKGKLEKVMVTTKRSRNH